MAFVQHMLFDAAIPAVERQNALDRARSDPGIPESSFSTSPFWLRQPHPRLASIQSDSIPGNADVVIVGSGITSTSITRSLLQSSGPIAEGSNPPRIVILEARDICSGATGRNGGHILETAEEFADLVDAVGLESAQVITRLRLSHLDELIAVAKDFDLTEEAQVRRVQFLSAHFDEVRWSNAVESINLFKEAMPTEAAEWMVITQQNILQDLSLPRAVGVIAGPAGALWPYKFVTGLLSRLLDLYPDNLKIETNTSVISVERSHDNDLKTRPYEVVTSRGSIHCNNVIHCTNAHVAHLVPSLRSRIYPIRGHMSAQEPIEGVSPQGTRHSWLFNYSTGFDYLTQLPRDSRSADEMMLGGGFAQSEYGGIKDIGIATDGTVDESAKKHLSNALKTAFGQRESCVLCGSNVRSIWSGNMGFSADGFPWVGRVPEPETAKSLKIEIHPDQPGEHILERRRNGEWVCAGFSGEGMVHAWRCGTALATMLLQGDDSNPDDMSRILPWFPKQMLMDQERINRVSLPSEI